MRSSIGPETARDGPIGTPSVRSSIGPETDRSVRCRAVI
nr:hypothetical protein JVH1_3776 [Rhodococcus sp. JVH1]